MERAFSHSSVMDGVKHDGNMLVAFFSGLLATAIAICVWAAISMAVGYHAFYLAPVAAALVGGTIRAAGGGSGVRFGLLGVAFTFVSGVPSALLSTAQLSTSNLYDIYSVLIHIDLVPTVTSIATHTTPLMYAVYAVSLVEAYLLSTPKAARE